jgi:hypothetical protein
MSGRVIAWTIEFICIIYPRGEIECRSKGLRHFRDTPVAVPDVPEASVSRLAPRAELAPIHEWPRPQAFRRSND